MCEVKVGDIIYFTHNDEIGKYKVIVSEEGHLVDGGRNIIGNKTKYILLAHLSEENNTKDLAYNTLINRLTKENLEVENIIITSQNKETEIINI